METTIQWLKSISWTSSPDAFAVLMHHHLRRRDAEGAQATYEQGLRAGVRPRNAIVETLVETLALSGRVAEAERHFWQLQPYEVVYFLGYFISIDCYLQSQSEPTTDLRAAPKLC